MSDKLEIRLTADPIFCGIFQEKCRGQKCPAWKMIPEGEDCPIGLDPDAIEAVKQAMVEAARYVDRRLNLDRKSGEDILTQVRQAIQDGKIEWAGIFEDLLKLDS